MLLSVVGVSVGINTYFLKMKIDEIGAVLHGINEATYTIRVENATRDADMNTVTTQVSICFAQVEKLEERLRLVEKTRR